ncbi:MAG: prepilin peptidase [Fimbriimonas sp.]
MGVFPDWTWVMGFIFGASIGSFLNVVIYRLPRGLSLSNPPKSFCPKCKHSLELADLMPLLSWLLSKGRCRYCDEKVSSRYFFVELLTGSLWGAIWWRFLCEGSDPLGAGFFAAVSACLVAIIFIDWELYIIPDELNAILLFFSVAYHVFNRSLPVALTGALLGWGLLWGIAFLGRVAFGKDAMGHGDIKMMRGVGALIGPLLLGASVALAVVAGLVIGLLIMAFTSKKKPETAEGATPEEYLPPESIKSLVALGLWYLLCLDVIAVFYPQMYTWLAKVLGEEIPEETFEEVENWTPTPTTIPFGPYLAIGALVCMIIPGPIEKLILDYWKGAMGG